MPKQKAMLLLLTVLLIVTTDCALTITSVSLQFPGTTTSLVGSVMGGTKIYISGLGFSPIMSDNTMFVGDFPCKLQDGATDTTILCTTSPTDSLKEYYNLPITVNVLGIGQATAIEKFSYVNSQTPLLYNIFPSVSYGGEETLLYLSGLHRISYLGADKDLGHVYGIYIDQSICSRFGLFQDAIDPNSNKFIQCYQPTLQQAGKYNVSEHLYAGRSMGHELSYKASLQNEKYQFVVLPLVNKTTQSGSIAGQEIEITGTGFSTDPQNITVSIDGVNCQVSQSTLTTIKCKLDSLLDQPQSILQSNSDSPSNQYTSGSGFFYQSYDISQISPQTVQKFKSLLDAETMDKSKLMESRVSGEIRTGDYLKAPYGQVWRGYFVPSQTGEYIFRGVADDSFAVYLSTQTYGSTISLTEPLIYANSWSPTALYGNYYYNDFPTAQSAGILLQKGKHYYMEAYHINYGGTGSFSLSVQVPNKDANVQRWQTYEVQSISTSMTEDPEIIEFTSKGVTSGTINLKVYEVNRATLEVTINQNVTIPWNANATQFCNALNQFSWFGNYGTTCTLVMKDNTGQITTNLASAVEFIWTVSIAKFRTADLQAHQFITTYSDGSGQFSATKIQDHSPIMSGTFTLTLDNTPIVLSNNVTDIPFNVDAGTIENALRKRAGFQFVRVERAGQPTTGCKWNIYYIGYNGNVPDIVVSGAGLMGGKAGTSPSITFSTRREYSTNLLVDPIDYRWMKTYSDKANVMVKVNGIDSACNTDCRYTFLQQVPRVTNVELDGYTLTLTLTDPQSINLPLDQITVILDNQPCISITGTLTSFTCELPYNQQDMSPILSAGSHYPVILLGSLGYADIDDELMPIDVSLEVFSLDLAQGPANGGYRLTVNGTGFPSSQINKKQIFFTLCDKQCPVHSITSNQAVITVPSCEYADFSTFQVQFNNMTDTLSFKYTEFDTSVQINSISPSSWSPVQKGVMTISGQGFGNDMSILQAYMSNSSGNIYKMKVLKGNDTQLKIGIPGGLPGMYKINIYKQGFGYAALQTQASNTFTYEVSVSSITPSSGSINGGTLLTIMGKNFVPDALQTMVTIGDQLNQLCMIQTITETEIKCRTPIKNQYYDIGQKLQVIVDSKLIIPTNCSSLGQNCWFSYVSQQQSPYLESLTSTAVSASGSLTLTGQRFDIGQSVKVSLYNKITKKTIELTPTLSNATSITVTLPNLESGFYDVKARVDPIGESNAILLQANLDLKSPSVSQISINGGQIAIQGWGLPQSWPKDYYKKLSFTKDKLVLPLDIISLTTTKIVLKVPGGKDGQIYKLSVISPTGISKTVQFSLSLSKTPTVDLTSTQTISPNTQTLISLNRTSMTTINPTTIQFYSVTNPSFIYTVSSWTNSSTVLTFNVTLNSGGYKFRLYNEIYGWYSTTQRTFLNVQKSGTYSVSSSPLGVSYNGGTVTVYGNYIGDGAVIVVNGQKGAIKSRTVSSAGFYVPKLITPLSQEEFKIERNLTINLLQKNITLWGDSPDWQAAFDKQHSTTYFSPNSTCTLGIDIGQNLGIQLTRIRYFPNSTWKVASSYIKDAVFEVSNDNITYTRIGIVDQNVHAGWNTIMINDQSIYRYVRFIHENGQSFCSLAQFQISGVIMSTVQVTDTTNFLSDLVIDDGFTQQTLTGALAYRKDKTPIVNSVTPDKGDVFGGYEISITGQYFDVATPTVFIDGIQCAVVTSSATEINCTVGERLDLPSQVSFNVMIGPSPAILKSKFRYVMRWSDSRTWGTDLPPIQNDLVYVPQGMHLLVDQTTPILAGIVVENATIEFADQRDMIIQSGFITLRGGEFIAGTEERPYQHQLTFIMHGNYYGTQQPMFGNKGIGCLQCKFSMIGRKRTPTWTTIASTINPGENQFTTSQDVDWQVGEVIVIASTSYDHNEAQMRTITHIEGRQITVDKNFVYQHYSDVETYGQSDKLQMRAQVGLLSRNIKMMGDDQSIKTDYGSHLMLAGSAENGLVGKIAYVEFTKCGQPQILGRYCHHFHMNGDVSESYSIGNSVHHSMARILTIHGVHFLYVAWNVGYRVKGHNFFIQDGVETNNILEYNLAISTLQVNNMLQTDMSVSSFWVTNPSNHLRYNRAAGSDFYGIWYEIKQHPDGPSATMDICPIGNPSGESHDNVAHSNVRFGLRIFRMYARQYPCLPIRDDTLVDPWSANPSIQSKFYNYELWKNGQAGLLAQQVGNMIFENFTIAESKLAGIQFYMTNFTKQRVIAKNMAIIGRSTGNPPKSDLQLNKSHGAILSRTGQLQLQNIRFYEFTQQMTVWQACSKCDNVLLYTNFGAAYYTSQIQYSGISGKFLNMLGLKRQVFYDLDGTLTKGVFDSQTRTSGTLAFGWPHLLQDPACLTSSTPQNWDTATTCDQTVTMRQVMFTNLQNVQQFRSQSLKARMLGSVQQVTPSSEIVYTSVLSLQQNMQPKKEMKFTFSLPYLTNRIYNIWWGTGINFQHMAMVSSHLFTQQDKGIVFKFNYTQNRELFEIGPLRQGKAFDNTLMKSASSQLLDMSSCGNGDYYHDNSDDKRVLNLCASGKNRTLFEYTDVNAIYCRYLCPAPPGSCTKQTVLRNWSNATQWPNSVMPLEGDNVTIPCQWTVMMDIQPSRIGYFEINGDIIIPDTQDILIEAENIWIKSGSLKAGTKTTPFSHQLTIQVNGNMDDIGLTVSPDLTGNKMIVNTGRLELFGTPPITSWTKLTSFANAGDTSINVLSAQGWKVGDEIGIAPSFMAPTEFEKVTITSINGNTVNFTPALKYNHFGDTKTTIQKSYGSMDTRTGVAHLTRNIKIKAGPDAGWGFHLVQFGYLRTLQQDNSTIIQTGNMTLVGVEFINGGQYDTERAALEIVNVRRYTEHTLISQSSFHECQDFCLRAENVYDVEIDNNVFFNARKFHVRALDIYGFTFADNLMIGVTKRSTMTMDDLIGCFASWNPVDAKIDMLNVTNNLCQGSQGNGYIVPDVDCEDMEIYPFAGNTAGSCDIGWIFARGNGDCLAAKGVYAYSSQIGQMHNPPDTITTKFKNFILADNVRSMTIRIGGSSSQKTGYLYDSYITAISRPQCTKCYGSNANPCTDNHGVRMLTTGSNGEKLPGKFGHGFDVVCKQQTIDGKAFIYNTQFDNFRSTYTYLPQCSNNVIFKPHSGGTDFIGSHHLFNSTCNNCQLTAFAYFSSPPQNQLGWFGGCGDILCTGFNNYYIRDADGTMLPQKGILLANNSWIGDNTQTCQKIQSINGYYCKDQDFSVLEYESVAPDYNTRIMWPVMMTPQGKAWTSVTNGWREWQWNGGQPLNKRLGRFVSVLPLQKMYNMTFTSQPPQDMTLKLQKRLPEGNSSDWVIVKLMYPKPNSIRVEINGQGIRPIQLKDNETQLLDTTQCGSNKFFYKNNTIHFVVTGHSSCKVRVTLTNSIQLTTKFDMNIDDFYKDDGVTKFINRLCALLQITDISRVKVVGVWSGSVNVVANIEPQISSLDSSTSSSPSTTNNALNALNTELQQLITNGGLQSAMTSQGFGSIISASSGVTQSSGSDNGSGGTDNGGTDNGGGSDNNNTTPQQTSSSSSNTGMIVGIVVGVVTFVCLILVGVFCVYRKGVHLDKGEKYDIEDQFDNYSDTIKSKNNPSAVSAVELKERKDFFSIDDKY